MADYHRSKDDEIQQQPHSVEDESGDASEYNPPPRDTTNGTSKRARGTTKKRGRYMTKRRLEELQASQDLQAPVETVHVETGASATANAERSIPSMNDQTSLKDQSREVIDLEDGPKETLDSGLDASEPVLGRGGKRRAVANRHMPTKRPRRAMAVDQVRLPGSRFSA